MGEVESSEAIWGLGRAACTSGMCTSNWKVQFRNWRWRNWRGSVLLRPSCTAWDSVAQGGCRWPLPGCYQAAWWSPSNAQAASCLTWGWCKVSELGLVPNPWHGEELLAAWLEPHTCQVLCASRRPWKTVGKSDVALQLSLLACLVSQVGPCWAWEHKQEKKQTRKKRWLRDFGWFCALSLHLFAGTKSRRIRSPSLNWRKAVYLLGSLEHYVYRWHNCGRLYTYIIYLHKL